MTTHAPGHAADAHSDNVLVLLRFYLGDGVLRRSLTVALVVGTLLNLIAQGDFLLAGEPLNWWKVVLTYLVPFGVATYGAVTARRQWRCRMDALGAEHGDGSVRQERPR